MDGRVLLTIEYSATVNYQYQLCDDRQSHTVVRGKTGAEKSRDMTIYGESGVDGPRKRVSAPIDTFPFLESLQVILPSTLLSLLPPSSPLGFS